MLEAATLQVRVELLLDVRRQVPVTLSERGQEIRAVALHQLVEQRVFGTVAPDQRSSGKSPASCRFEVLLQGIVAGHQRTAGVRRGKRRPLHPATVLHPRTPFREPAAGGQVQQVGHAAGNHG